MVTDVSLKPRAAADFEDLSTEELEALLNPAILEIPLPNSTKEISLDRELAQHYGRVRNFLYSIKDEEGIPANQVAQVFNTLTQVLAQITKLQQAVQNIKRLEAVEAALVRAMQTCPDEVKNSFFAEYEKIIEKYEI